MFSPFEELENLVDYLPEEGETVLITREAGELVCKPCSADDLREGVDNAELYGCLVQVNERLQHVGIFPLWVTSILLVWLVIFLHGVLGLSWERWYVAPGVAILILPGTAAWIQHRRRHLFRLEISPLLNRELLHRGISPAALIAGVRQHQELRTLFDEMVKWFPVRTAARFTRDPL